MYRTNKKGWLKHFDFTLLDLICMILAFFLAFIIRFNTEERASLAAEYNRIAIILILIQLCVGFFTESYKNILKRGALIEFWETLKDALLVFVALLSYMWMFQRTEYFSRLFQGLFYIFMFFFMYFGRQIWKKYLLHRLKRSKNANFMLIVGLEDNIKKSISEFQEGVFLDSVIVGAVVIDKDMVGKKILNVPVVANAETVYDYAATHVIDEVFLNGSDQKTCENMADIFLQMGLTVHINLIRVSTLMPNRNVERCGNFMVLTTSMKIATPKQLLIKRVTDIVGSVVGLLITLILLVIFGPIIKIQSPGPIFFKQVRIGKNGRKFNMYKFRSMVPNAEELKESLAGENEMEGNMFKMENDPRIIPIGRFMRRYSLDEFPQFWSVLKGDMSLVGTRPPTEEEYVNYDLHHRARLGSKPGITGLWQVSGRNEIKDFEEIVALDTQYIAEWSISLDIKILAKTIGVVFKGEGAY